MIYRLEAYTDSWCNERICRFDSDTPFETFQYDDELEIDESYYKVIDKTTQIKNLPDGTFIQITRLLLEFDYRIGPNGEDTWKD